MKLNDVKSIVAQSAKKRGFWGLRDIFLAYTNLKREPLIMSNYPLLLQIEPTTHCNLNCRMCLAPISRREKRHILFEEFKEIIRTVPSVEKISLVGAGEPLLNPSFFDMIDYAKSRGILIGFATNGHLLNHANCTKVIESSVDWLNISLDSSNKSGYEYIRDGADFGQLTENIRRLMKMLGKGNVPDVSLWFVLMKDNLKELPDIVKLTKKLGAGKIRAQLQHCWGSKNIRNKFEQWPTEKDRGSIKSILIEANQVALREKVNFGYVNIPDISQRRGCKWPWKSCYITVEGFVTPCCLQGADPEVINFGNIFKESFETIWNNEGYSDFRRLLSSSNGCPDICVGCPAYHQRLKI